MGYVGVPPQSGFITTAKQRVTSSTNNYVDLDHSISSLADVIVWVNFVKQDSTNLTLTTSTRITLGGTLVSSDIVEISFLGKAVATQTPDTGTVTNDMLAGSIANSKLANSSITLNGSAVSLGGSASVGNPTHISRLENDTDATSLSIQSCFSSTYDIYKVVFYIATTQANGDLYLKFLKNTSDDFTGTDLNGNLFGELGTTSPTHFDNGGVSSSTFLKLANNDIYSGASSGITGEILIAYPFLRSNNRIHINYHGTSDGSSGVTTYVGGWVYSGSEIATGLKFYSGSGPTRLRVAEINVYGYNK